MRANLLSLLLVAALSATAADAAVTDAMIENDAKTTGEVRSWGIGQQGQRYSPQKQINASTIKRLVPVWSFSFGGEKQRGQDSQPLIHNGKMFVTASYSRISALDAKTGAELWKYEHRLPEGNMPCCDVINRGAAQYDNLVIFATLDAQFVALNQDTGDVVWKEKIDDFAAGYSARAAPLFAQGLLLTSVSGGEFGVVGRVEARDPKTGLAYFGTGSPAPWNSHLRKGDNLYSTSTVAIDIKTGQIVWHYQNTPNDAGDCGGVNEFVTRDEGSQVLGGKADRNGFFCVNDAKTGKIVWEVPNNAPLWVGALTTSGNLVWWGAPEGFPQAADAKTGKVVWKFQTGSGVVAPPITWDEGSEQPVAVAIGWGGAVPLWGGDLAKKVSFLE